MDKLRLSEEHNKATHSLLPAYVNNVKRANSESIKSDPYYTVKSPHDCKHAFVESCLEVLKTQFLIWYRHHFYFGKGIHVSTKVDCQS